MSNSEVNNWQYWKERSYYQRELRDRALGLLPEMESAKQIARLVGGQYRDGDRILDAGCGTGHYILSLQKHLGKNFAYTGVDLTQQHISDARRIFSDYPHYTFLEGDVRSLPFAAGEFDITICCNTIPHVPRAAQALRELARVTRKMLLVRMLVGDQVLITKTAFTTTTGEDGEPSEFAYNNIYTRDFVAGAIGGRIEDLEFLPPHYDEASIRAHFERHSKDAGASWTTRIIDGCQVKGYLILPWMIVRMVRNV